MGDDIKVRAVIIYAETPTGTVYMHLDNQGNYVPIPSEKGAATFTPIDAQKFIRAAAHFPFALRVMPVK